MKQSIPAHQLSELFPLHDGPPLWELRKDIEEHGLLDPITTYQGKVLDGRRRQVCCVAAGIEPTYKPFKGDDAQALAFVVSKNLRRRHLGEAERAMVANKIANLSNGQRKSAASIEAAGPTVSQADAAEMMNVSRSSVQRAKTVQDHGTAELKQAVADGTVSLDDAAKVAKQPEPKQRAAVDAVRNGQAKTAAKAMTEAQMADTPSGGIKDAVDCPVPEKLVPVFRGRGDFREAEALCRQATAIVEAILQGPHGAELQKDGREILNHLSEAKKLVHWNTPHAVCPKCQTGRKDCAACKGRGWVVKAVYNQPGVGRDAK